MPQTSPYIQSLSINHLHSEIWNLVWAGHSTHRGVGVGSEVISLAPVTCIFSLTPDAITMTLNLVREQREEKSWYRNSAE
jgi:hypothetical protein